MTWLSRLFRRSKQDAQLDAELRFHVEQQISDNIAAGMLPEEARRRALAQFGGLEFIKEETRAARGTHFLETLLQDVRYALRMLRKSPGFTAVAVLTLALGIGANTAIFSVVEKVLLRPLPYPQPDRLVQISNNYLPQFPTIGLSPGDYKDWKRSATSFSAMGAYAEIPPGFNLVGQNDAERVQAGYASSSLFGVLGVNPVVGRFFLPGEDLPNSSPVAILSHHLWASRFGGDPAVLGRTIQLDHLRYTVVGVLPAGFDLQANDVWLPIGQFPDNLDAHIHHDFSVIARLKPVATVAQARAEIESLNHAEASAFPDTHTHWGVNVSRMSGDAAIKLRSTLLILSAAVGLVLLIACANIVNLLLVRNAAREREIVVRAALGARPAQLARQLLTESVLLAGFGGLVGVLFAEAALRALLAAAPPDLADLQGIGLNGRVLLFTAAVCLLAGILCGALPAAQSIKVNLVNVLRQSGKGSTGPGSHRVHRLLVVVEVAMAVVPLIGAGLLLRSFERMLDVAPGFHTQHLVTLQAPLAQLTFAEVTKLTTDQQTQLSVQQSREFENLAEQIRALPGVVQVGGVSVLPLLRAQRSASRFVLEGQPIPPSAARPVAQTRTVSLTYFTAAGIPLIQGRDLQAGDWQLPNIVINETMAKRYWPGGDALGRRVNLCSLDTKPCWFSIVGVVGNVKQLGLDGGSTFDVYFSGGWTDNLIIRATGDPLPLAQSIREVIRKVDPTLPVNNIRTMDDFLDASNAPRRFVAVLVGVFAALALLLAAVGIYGVMSYTTSRRTQEIGIRMALGAMPARVQWMMLAQSAKLAAAGLAIGLLGALVLVRFLSSFLFGVSPYDLSTFIGIPLLLAAVALLASYVPARRAMKVDPIVALRYE